MNPPVTLQRLMLGGLVLATIVYGAGFALDHYLRTRRGPWEVEFTADAQGWALLVIRQPRLGIESVTLTVEGFSVTNAATTVRFDAPRKPVPFGRVKYDDLSYLPGVVTLELAGHEVELLPRTLYLNRRSVPWSPRARLELHEADRPASWPDPPPPRPAARRLRVEQELRPPATE